MNQRLFYWLFPIMWMVVLFISSATPYERQDIKPLLASAFDLSFLAPYLNWVSFTYNQSEVSIASHGVNGLIEFFLRKGAHFGAFFILLILFYVAISRTVQWNLRKILVVSFSMTFAYAIMDELHQGLTPNRTPFYGDVLIDGLGAIAACFILLIWYKNGKKYKI